MKYLITIAALLIIASISTCALAQSKHAGFKYIDKINMDVSVNPGDNFYLYANSNWLKNNPVPGSKTRWGSFDMLREEVHNGCELY